MSLECSLGKTAGLVHHARRLAPEPLLQRIRPDVLVKGADWARKGVVGHAFVESYGGRVHLATLHHGHSTTNLIDRMRAA